MFAVSVLNLKTFIQFLVDSCILRLQYHIVWQMGTKVSENPSAYIFCIDEEQQVILTVAAVRTSNPTQLYIYIILRSIISSNNLLKIKLSRYLLCRTMS
jgi:hypothetical protein